MKWKKIDVREINHNGRYLIYDDNKGGIIFDLKAYIDESGDLTWLDPDFKDNWVSGDNFTHYMERPDNPEC